MDVTEVLSMTEVALAVANCAYNYYNFVKTYYKFKRERVAKKRRWWITLIHRNRTRQSMELQFFELLNEPSGEFTNFCRMSFTDFEYLLNKISPIISKQDTQMREAIPAKVRLAITFRFLATGDSYKSLHFLFKVSPQAISNIVPEVCAALNEVLKDEIKIPSTAEAWLAIEKGFENKFPHAIGAIDGKHVVLQCPIHSGSEYYNYKRTFSIVLLALVDSNYRFIFADIGSQGRISDDGIFRNSLLWNQLNSNNLNLPAACPLTGWNPNINLPYVFLADGAFALSPNVMKPYPGNHDLGSPKRRFNQTLSGCRVVVENVFGILASKFRIFKKPLLLEPDKAALITMTCVLLHNYLRKSLNSQQIYNPPGTIDVYDDQGNLTQGGHWRQELDENCAIRRIPQLPRRSPLNAVQIRAQFTSYFSNNIV